MTNRRSLLLFMLWGPAVACAARTADRVDRAAVAAIDALQKQADEAVTSGRPDGYVALLTDDAVLMPPDGPALSGKDAVRRWSRAFAEQFEFESYLSTDHEVVVAGDWAFRRASARWVIRPRTGGSSIREEGKFVIVYRRQPDGSWRIARDIFNRDHPAGQDRRH